MMSEVGEKGSRWRRNRWRFAGWGAAATLLILPLISMHFSDEVNWTLFDFIVFGSMLAVVGGVLELATRMTPNKTYRAAVAVALAAAFILVWMNGAVGIIGSEDNAANLMFFGVLAVGVVGAVIARRRSGGMARAMLATATAQVLVAVIAGLGGTSGTIGFDVFVITGFFVALWLMSAWLFKLSGQQTMSGTS